MSGTFPPRPRPPRPCWNCWLIAVDTFNGPPYRGGSRGRSRGRGHRGERGGSGRGRGGRPVPYRTEAEAQVSEDAGSPFVGATRTQGDLDAFLRGIDKKPYGSTHTILNSFNC